MFPSKITKCFTQRVAAYVLLKSASLRSFFYNAKSLTTAYGQFWLLLTSEDIVCSIKVRKSFAVFFKCILSISI